MPERIIGIDPGYGRLGFGIIEEKNREWAALHFGCIQTNPKDDFLHRLEELHERLQALLTKYHPTQAAVEDLFFSKNVKTAMKVGEARGAVLLTLHLAGIPIDEFTPLQMKQALTGYGRAEKGQMQKMVQTFLRLKKKPTSDDAADALAVALTCAATLPMKRRISKTSSTF